MRSIQAIIFDIGGVLIHENSEEWKKRWEQRLGMTLKELDKLDSKSGISYNANIGNFTEEEFHQELALIMKRDVAEAVAFRTEGFATYVLDRELADFLASLRPRYKTATLSNAWPGARRVHHNMFQLDELVDVAVYSSEEGMIKPDLRLFRRTLEKLNVQPDEAIYLDDSETHVYAAQRMGIRAIYYRSCEQAIEAIRAYI